MKAGSEQAMRDDAGGLLVVVPRLDDGRIILLRQGGLATDGLWQLPTCPLPPAHQDLTEAAVTLLHSTTDYVPGRIAPLGAFQAPVPGAPLTQCCLADGLRPSPLPPLHACRAMTTALPLAEVRHMIQHGLIRCSAVLSALTLLSAADHAAAGKTAR